MADDVQTIRHINWREAFTFTHLFRAFRIAIHPSKLVLGLLALLALYTGGRALDGLWRPRSLAVPGEVQIYEQLASKGGSHAQFAEDRLATREAIEEAYAARLMSLQLAPDHNAAMEDARRARKIGEIQKKIEEAREQAIKDAQAEKDSAWNAAESISDGNEKTREHRRIEEKYRERVASAYKNAYDDLQAAKLIKGVGLFHAFFQYETVQVVRVVQGVLRWNWLGGWNGDGGQGVFASIYNFFAIGPVWLMRHHVLYFIFFAILFLTVWAIFGGAIARIAAVHVARDEKLSVRAALSFSMGKFLSFVSAPLIPMIIILIVGLVPLAAGALSSIWFIGPIFNIIMGALFILILAAGFVMTLVLLGTFGGFNLMYPTIAVEGSDSFDAISRSFSYVYARPWRMLFYTLIAIIYGALTYLFVRMFIWLMLVLTHHFVGAGMWKEAPSLEPLWNVQWTSPSTTGTLSYDIDFLTLRKDQDIAAFFVAFWVYMVIGVLGAFAISFYFSANTIIYFLMRREVDATEMDDVYLEQSDEDFGESAPVTTEAVVVVAETTSVPPPGAESPEVGRTDEPPGESPST